MIFLQISAGTGLLTDDENHKVFPSTSLFFPPRAFEISRVNNIVHP